LELAELGLDINCTVYSHDDTSEKPGLHVGAAPVSPLVAGVVATAQPEAAIEPAAPAAEKSPAQLAAEQLLMDSFIAEQLHEQGLIDSQGQ
jgi:hypothetical protein